MNENYLFSNFPNLFIKYSISTNIYCLLNDKKSAQKVWSKDQVYKGTFQLSSRTPHAYKISYT